MNTIQLKTNINCGGCVTTVTPFLDEAVGKENWQVDTSNKDKILTVTKENAVTDEVIKIVQKAGFKAEKL